MKWTRSTLFVGPILTILLPCASAVGQPGLDDNPGLGDEKARVVAHWTGERRAAAVPRDLVMDRQGVGYLRDSSGSFKAYGHDARAASPMAKPPGTGGGGGGSSDTTPPVISGLDPAAGAVIGASHRFAATVTDDVGVRSATFVIQYPDGSTTQSFAASQEAGSDTWFANLQGFTDGSWSWWVEAKDTARKGGNGATSATVAFTVGAGGGTGGDSDTVTNAPWNGGVVQSVTGRIYFEMPGNTKWKGPWYGYVCSGTVVRDEAIGRSVILTAAHCVYDDANGAFARHVLFIPDQDGTSGSATDLNCSNDPIGCWVPSWGVVDSDWTTRVFPNNIAWDYAFYVVDDIGAHAQGPTTTSDVLDEAAGDLPISFGTVNVNDGDPGAHSLDFTHALGYSYSEDPNFMYCAEDMTLEGAVNWWLPSCGLSGGSSGGPWIQPLDTGAGSGPVMSVNSWGYTDSPGMAGPKLVGTSASCVFDTAAFEPGPTSAVDGEAGIAVVCN
jgi:hypothetical protein